jgi:S1-C subfamily serine protease
LSDDQGDLIASIPIRVSLTLMGTGISAEKVELMRDALPGLQIDHRQGGFLGVTCLDSYDVCKISGVLPDSAAEEAGLIEGDVIVRIGDTEIARFRDLQNAINQHLPGDEVEVKFQRGEKIETAKVRLRRFEET